MILILTQCFPPVFGGIETLMGGLADAIAASGRTVRVLADGAAGPDDARKPYAIERFTGWKPLRQRAKTRATRRLLGQAELVLADSWKSLERLPDRQPGRAGAARPRVHCLAHGMELPAAPSASRADRIRRAFARADLILASSNWTAGEVRRFAGATPVAVATPPLLPPEAATPSAIAAIESRIGPASALVATLCRLEPRKGVDRVIEAVAALAPDLPGLRYAVAGSGPDRDRLAALAAERGVADRVVFLGRVDESEKAALLTRADVFAMPSRREGASVEGFGIVYLEAGWCGTPSLAGREGGAADAVLDGETGLLCDGADAQSVRDGLARLATDTALRARLGAAARRHAESQLWERRLADYVAPAETVA